MSMVQKLLNALLDRGHILLNIRLQLTNPENVTRSPTTAVGGGRIGSTEV